ncbi:cilia- and flagella-associated protein HOATZ isoform X7 [Oncorhynchus keta]|uniref:cilia- and flagella-associated protein HOATZ isoform X7 n=1 Tax=Oncorhynchus keta TaxID=8018 RepID=UPI00227C2946|nr:cilia- and flagella-associated protein HOATZ isoform X7 [Oncorhynchus keta]
MFESEPRAGVTEEEERREAEQLETELDKYFFTVFDGSSPEDVSHAKQLWTSLSLLPPLESRLVNADIRQRLPIARTNQETLLVVGKTPMLLSNHLLRTIARRREDIINMLHQQRQKRIQVKHRVTILRETVSLPYKPRQRDKSERLAVNPPGHLDTDVEEVRRLQ